MKAAMMNGKMRQKIVKKKQEDNKEAKYISSSHITFSSISLLAPGRGGGLGEPGASLDWNGKEST